MVLLVYGVFRVYVRQSRAVLKMPSKTKVCKVAILFYLWCRYVDSLVYFCQVVVFMLFLGDTIGSIYKFCKDCDPAKKEAQHA